MRRRVPSPAASPSPPAASPSASEGWPRPACGPASSDSDRIARPLDAPCASWPDGSCTRPSRRSSRPTSPRWVHRSAASRIRSRYSAVNCRLVGLASTSGSGTAPAGAAPAGGASSLRSSTPAAGSSEPPPNLCFRLDIDPPCQRVPSTIQRDGRCVMYVGREGIGAETADSHPRNDRRPNPRR